MLIWLLWQGSVWRERVRSGPIVATFRPLSGQRPGYRPVPAPGHASCHPESGATRAHCSPGIYVVAWSNAAPAYSLWTLLLFFCLNSIKYTCSLPQITKKFKTALPSIQYGHNPQCNSYKHLLTLGVIVTCSLALPPLRIPSSPRAAQTDILSPILSDREFDSAPFIPTLLFSAGFYGAAVRGGGRICGNI